MRHHKLIKVLLCIAGATLTAIIAILITENVKARNEEFPIHPFYVPKITEAPMITPVPTPIPTTTPMPEPTAEEAISSHIPDHYHSGYWIEIHLSQQIVYLYKDRVLVGAFPCSTGKKNPTPTGEFFIDYRVREQTMQGNPVEWVSYLGGSKEVRNIAFHNVKFLTDQGKPEGLGAPTSAGCIRMSTEGAQTLYYHVSESKYVDGHLQKGSHVCIHD